MTSNGNVNFAMFVATCGSAVSGSLDSIYSGTNFAAAASLRSNVSRSRCSFERSLLGGTQRSSHNVTVTSAPIQFLQRQLRKKISRRRAAGQTDQRRATRADRRTQIGRDDFRKCFRQRRVVGKCAIDCRERHAIPRAMCVRRVRSTRRRRSVPSFRRCRVSVRCRRISTRRESDRSSATLLRLRRGA